MKLSTFLSTLPPVALALTPALFAQPQGMQPIHGTVSVIPAEEHVLQLQTGHQTVIHWESFSIDSQETTRFVMPSSSASVLNRVVGGNLSEIYGTLEANGKVYLLNPRGVLVGKEGVINTASFFASTLDVLDADFLRGQEISFTGHSTASVINLGKITAWDGDIALIACHLDNQGTLEANNGVAALAAGTNVLLQPSRNERILIRVSTEETPLETGITNSGQITALQAELKAEGNPYLCAIKDGGKIDALATQEQGGRIYLVAEKGRVEATGSYVATNPIGKGNEVHLLGKEVILDANARIDVSGVEGGGVLLVGGDYQGSNPAIFNAESVQVGPGVCLSADALLAGDGGKVILWGDRATAFGGTISAKGGDERGDGGFVEVSSPGLLQFSGIVDRTAPRGLAGTLLLDPTTVTISTGADSGFTGSYAFNANTATVNNANLQTNLGLGPVVINASAGTGAAAFGSITVSAPINWSAPNSLTLTANDSGSSFIAVNDLITSTDNTVAASTNLIILNGGGVTIGAASATTPSALQATNGGIQITATTLSVSGGMSAGASALISSTSGNISIQASGAVQVLGGSALNALAQITADSSSNPISIAAAGLTLMGGTGSGAFSQVLTSGGLLSLNGFSALNTGSLLIQGGTNTNTRAYLGTTTAALTTATNAIEIGQIVPLTNITLTGGSGGGTSRAQLYTDTGGNIVSTITGSYTLSGGSGVSDTQAGIFTGLTSGTGNITLTGGGSVSITGGTGSVCDASVNAVGAVTCSIPNQDYILTGSASLTSSTAQITATRAVQLTGRNLTLTAGSTAIADGSDALIQSTGLLGGITLNCTGTITLNGGSAGAQNSYIRTTGASGINPINITCAGLNLNGSNTAFANNATAQILSSFGSIFIGVGGPINLTSGTQSGASARIAITAGNTAHTIGLESIGLSLAAHAAQAEIVSLGGAITIDGTSSSSGAIQVHSFSADALIHTTTNVPSGDAILIGQTIGKAVPTNLSLLAGNGRALISTDVGGNIVSTISGTHDLAGGTLVLGNSVTGIVTGLNSGTGNIQLTGVGDFTLTGGSGDQSNADVNAQGTLTCAIGAHDYILQGGSGFTTALARMTGTGAVSASGNNFTLTAGSSSTASGSNALIQSTGASGSVLLTATNAITANAGSTSGQSALIATTSGTGANPVTVTCNTLTLNGGSSGLATNSSAEVSTNSGNINITATGNIALSGGTAAGTNALIQSTTIGTLTLEALNLSVTGGVGAGQSGLTTASGDIHVSLGQNCTYSAPNPGALAVMQTFGSDLTVIARGSILLSGASAYSTPQPGNLLLIAGVNIELDSLSSVIANGTSSSSLTLVVDNNYPAPPGIGPGQFILNSGATLTAGMGTPLRIFTADRNQNTIGAPINGVVFVPGPEFINSATEVWDTYFPSSFYGGTGFTLFYKNEIILPPAPLTPSDLALIETRSAFVTSELFFDLHNTYSYDDFETFEDYLYWSTFNVGFDHARYSDAPAGMLRSDQVLKERGLWISHLKLWNRTGSVPNLYSH